LFAYIFTTILSDNVSGAVVARAFILISTGFVLLVSQPINVESEVNNNVSVPPVIRLLTVKYISKLSFCAFFVA